MVPYEHQDTECTDLKEGGTEMKRYLNAGKDLMFLEMRGEFVNQIVGGLGERPFVWVRL